MSIERKLAAIMFTDIVGYTALSAKDSTKASKLLKTQRDTLKPIVEEYGGSWMKEIGDGLLLTFDSATSAVECSIAIQKTTKDIEELNLRIGIHQGEVIKQDGDVIGDDVNITSRIEPFSAVGGVAISDKIYRDISSNQEFETKFVGQPKLKGVAQEVKVYCIISHGLPETDISKVLAKLEKESKFNFFTLTGGVLAAIGIVFWIGVGFLGISFGDDMEIPSVAILMMENLGDEDEDFWARGMTGDLIIKIASSGNVRVPSMKEISAINIDERFKTIAEKLNVKYILTSELYKTDSEFQLRSQLINTYNGASEYANKWTETIDKSSDIVNQLSKQLLEIVLPNNRPIEKQNLIDSKSYSLYLKAKSFSGESGSYRNLMTEEIKQVRNLFYKSINLDSTNIDARIQLARTFNYSENPDSAITILNNSLSITDINQNKKLRGRIYSNLGISYRLKDRELSGNDTAYSNTYIISNYKKAADIAKDYNDVNGYWNAKRHMMITLLSSSYPKDSLLVHSNELLNYAIEQNNLEIEADVYGIKGLFYYYKRNITKAKYYIDKALALDKHISISNKIKYLKTLSDIGSNNSTIYEKQILDKEILNLSRQIKDNSQIVSVTMKLIKNYMYPISNFKKSEDLINDVLKYENLLHEFKFQKFRLYLLMTKNNLYQGKYKDVLFFSKKIEDIYEQPDQFLSVLSNIFLAYSYFYLNDHMLAKTYFDNATNLMGAVGDRPDFFSLSYLNEIKLGNYNKTDLLINNPFSELLKENEKISINDLSRLLLKMDILELTKWMEKDLIIMNFHTLYNIYSLLGDKATAVKHLARAHDEIMRVKLTLKEEDKTNFLSKNYFVKMVLLEWNKLGDNS